MQPSQDQPSPPQSPPLKERSFSEIATQGSLWSLISSGTGLLSGLITAPFFLKALGEADYGALILIGVVIAYAEIADLGITLSCIRHASAALRAGAYAHFYAILGTAWLIYGSTGLLTTMGVLLLAPWIMEAVFHLPPELIPNATKALQISAVTFGVNFIIGIPQLIPIILSRSDLHSKLSAFHTLSRLLIGLATVTQGGGIVGLAFAYLSLEVLMAILTFFLVRRLLPDFPRQLRLEASAARQIFQLGRVIMFNGILLRLLNQWEKTLLGRYAGSALLPYYTVPLSLTSQFILIPGALGGSLLPELSGLYAKGDSPAATRLLTRSQQVAYLVLFAITAFLGICTFDLLSLWIGGSFATSATEIMRVLLLGGLMQSMLFLYHLSLGAQGKPNRTTWVMMGAGAIHLPLSFFLVQSRGLQGASWALALRHALELIGTMLVFPGGAGFRSLRNAVSSQAASILLIWALIWGLAYAGIFSLLPLLLRVGLGAVVFWGGWMYIVYRWGLYAHELESLLNSLPLPGKLKKYLLRRL